MQQIRSFDEVNDILGYSRSETYDKYFGDMDLTDEEKSKRIDIAKELEAGFLYVLAYIFTSAEYDNLDWYTIRLEFERVYREAISGVIDIDDYIDNYIYQFAEDVTSSTRSHIGGDINSGLKTRDGAFLIGALAVSQEDLYYISHDRAIFIAENEANSFWNYGDYKAAILSGKSMKQWIDIRDRKERETHRRVGGTIISIYEPFMVGSSFMEFPKDTSYGASASEIVNCRCSARYF